MAPRVAVSLDIVEKHRARANIARQVNTGKKPMDYEDPRARNGIATRFKPGQSGNPAGPKPGYRQTSQIQMYALARCREAIDVVTRVMREPKDGDKVRLHACEMILDRGLGRPNQAVALDVALKKPLENMSLDELQQFRERYAALVTASPKLIEHVIEQPSPAEELTATSVNCTDDGVSEQ